MTDILAADRWATNGELIADVAALGYLQADRLTLDCTYGRGVFWRQWRPDRMITVGYPTEDPRAATPDTLADFRRLPFPDNTFPQVVFDPPYMPKGTPAGLAEMDTNYGVGNRGQTAIWNLMANGLAEAIRVCQPAGTIVTKAGRGIDGGRLWRGDDALTNEAERLGCEVVAQFRMLTRPRPQRHRGPQQNPRSNYSTLTVLRAPDTPKPPLSLFDDTTSYLTVDGNPVTQPGWQLHDQAAAALWGSPPDSKIPVVDVDKV